VPRADAGDGGAAAGTAPSGATDDGRGYDPAKLALIANEVRAVHGTASEIVLGAIRRAILEGVLEPGARLRQEDLATVFGTSRIPVREALRALEYDGLVESEPHRGFTVTALDPDDINDVYELRIVLETYAIRLAVPLLTEADLVELSSLYQAMVETHDPDAQLARRERFYLHLFAISGRPRLVSIIERLRQEVARPLRWRLVQHSLTHHEEFFEAIKAGNAERAAQKLAAHYRKVAALLRRFLRESEQARRLDRRNGDRVTAGSRSRPAR
jgi:DNA-binding GntR family transcriptional regulator